MVVGNDVGAQVLAKQDGAEARAEVPADDLALAYRPQQERGPAEEAVNDAVAKMLADGTLNESSEAWLKTPLNPDNL